MPSILDSKTTDWASTAGLRTDTNVDTTSSVPLRSTLSDDTDTDSFADEFKRGGPSYARAYAEDQARRKLSVPRNTSTKPQGPWLNTAVLSIDGGGIRGLSTLYLLRALMQRVALIERTTHPPAAKSSDSPLVEGEALGLATLDHTSDEENISGYRPCHYFDYIAGTSTGGLIAIMLGRLRMDVQQTITRYLEVIWEVYAQRRRRRVDVFADALLLKRKSRDLREKKFQQVITSLESVHRDSDSQLTEKKKEEKALFKSDVARCRTIVLSLEWSEDKSSLVPFLFKSYDEELGRFTSPVDSMANEKPLKLHISQVAMAASWSPSFREPLLVGNRQFIDTAKVVSNPTLEVYNEITYLNEERSTSLTSPDATTLFVSIGCGKGSAFSQHRLLAKSHHLGVKSSQSWNKVVSDLSEEVDHKMREYESKSTNFRYHRFDVAKGLEDLQWKDCTSEKKERDLERKIKTVTSTYLQRKEISVALTGCAEMLVQWRRLRAQTRSWETFAFGSRYNCPLRLEEACRFSKSTSPPFDSRDDLLDHLRRAHGAPPADAKHHVEIRNLLERGRTNSD